MVKSIYTVEWGHYTFNGRGEKVAQIQDGDIEVMADSEKDAIKRANVPDYVDWCHSYKGTSKWL